MDNYRKRAISNRMSTSLGQLSRQNEKPFKNDGFIQHIQYIEEVGIENLPDGYIEAFRERYGSKKRDRKVCPPEEKMVKGYTYTYIYDYMEKNGPTATSEKLNISRSTVYKVKAELSGLRSVA